MAIQRGGINDAFSGKVGSVVGVVRLGTAIIRSAPKKSKKNKKGSELQNEKRSAFTKMQTFLSPMLGFIRVGFNLNARSRSITAHNAAKSYNMLNALTAEGEIDYGKILVSFGNLPGAVNAAVVSDDAGVHFSWTNNAIQKWAAKDDQVMLLAYDPKGNEAYAMLSGARRNAETETLNIDAFEEATELHTWIAFIADNRERISMSTYVGVITVG